MADIDELAASIEAIGDEGFVKKTSTKKKKKKKKKKKAGTAAKGPAASTTPEADDEDDEDDEDEDDGLWRLAAGKALGKASKAKPARGGGLVAASAAAPPPVPAHIAAALRAASAAGAAPLLQPAAVPIRKRGPKATRAEERLRALQREYAVLIAAGSQAGACVSSLALSIAMTSHSTHRGSDHSKPFCCNRGVHVGPQGCVRMRL